MSEQSQCWTGASASGCGATGTPPQYPAGRATSLERGHWSFDQAAYRRERYLLLLSPALYGAMAMVAALFMCAALLLVAAGAN